MRPARAWRKSAAADAAALAALLPLRHILLSYVMSYVYLGIYWSNHHHLLQATQHVDGRVLWANLHLLFWLSLVPFVTAWLGDSHFGAVPVAFYGVVLLLAAIAYFILTRALLALHPKDSKLAIALGSDFKGKISVVIYMAAVDGPKGPHYIRACRAFATRM